MCDPGSSKVLIVFHFWWLFIMFGVFSMFLQLNLDVLSCDHKDPNAFTRGSVSS